MNVQIQGTNIEITDELYDFVHNKLADALEALGSLDRDPVKVDVELERTTRRHPKELEDQRRYRAETNVTVPSRLIRAERSADTMHQAIVEMKHVLTRELREWREQVIDDRRAGGRQAKHQLGEEIAAEEFGELSEDEEFSGEEGELGEFSESTSEEEE